MNLNCPINHSINDRVLLGHGSGGRLSHQLITEVFLPVFNNPFLNKAHDGSVFPVEKGRMAVTTDSFVVDPLIFPGGNIGDLAINGTVNDLACCGAVPKYITVGFILEEGLPIDVLKLVAQSMRTAADNAGVLIITGDTKVVDRGKCDKMFINTTGIGIIEHEIEILAQNATEGDVVICSGEIGVHGITILSTRDSLGFETNMQSDTAPLHRMVNDLLDEIDDIHVLRDPTRGGVSSTLNEIAQASDVEIELYEQSLPIPRNVQAASELLGLDPLYIANEGVILVILPEKQADKAIQIMKRHREGKNAVVIGKVAKKGTPKVVMKTTYGGSRMIPMLHGDQLPRIC